MKKTIIDDGKKSTSELLKAIGCEYWSYLPNTELDKQFPKVKTARTFTWVQEADENLKNISAEDWEKKAIQTITLRERLIMEKMWFEETGTHMDIDNWTLCVGSRDRVGGVPGVYWGSAGGKLYVGWYDPQVADGDLHSRAAVSLEPLSLNPSDSSLENRKRHSNLPEPSEDWQEKMADLIDGEQKECLCGVNCYANDIIALAKEVEKHAYEEGLHLRHEYNDPELLKTIEAIARAEERMRIYTGLLAIADKGELEELRREVELYFKDQLIEPKP